MWKTAWIVLGVSLMAPPAASSSAQTLAAEPSVSSPDASPITRVRSTDATITALIALAIEQSATFRGLAEKVGATDGIVYVEPGRCGPLRACLALKVTIAEPHRILWIVVDPQRRACDVMASIGHELWHALEVLRERWIRSDGEMYSFIAKGREQNPPSWFETEAAVRLGQDVRGELRESCDSRR